MNVCEMQAESDCLVVSLEPASTKGTKKSRCCMTEAELKRHLAQILTEEDRGSPNWGRIENMCLSLSKELSIDACDTCPHHIYHFIADCDIRQRNNEYGEKQRADVRTYLEARISD